MFYLSSLLDKPLVTSACFCFINVGLIGCTGVPQPCKRETTLFRKEPNPVESIESWSHVDKSKEYICMFVFTIVLRITNNFVPNSPDN